MKKSVVKRDVPLVEREALKSEFCLVFEPSMEGKVKTGRKGTGGYVLKTHGIPSHAGFDPDKGASAILEMANQIEKLHALTKCRIGHKCNGRNNKGRNGDKCRAGRSRMLD